MQMIQDVLSSLESNGVSCQLAELVRYRALANRLNLAPSGSIKSSMAGALSSKFKGRGMEFDEARHYQPGDDIRSIDWRVTARTGKTHTKLYREERERPVLIYLDLSASMHFGTELLYKSVQALHATALITFSALSRGDKIGSMVVSEQGDVEHKPKGSAKHGLAMLNQIVNTQKACLDATQSRQSTKQAVIAENNIHQFSKLAMLARPGTLVYVISDFLDFTELDYATLGKISRHCEVRPLRIFDAIEQALPHVNNVQDVLLTNGQNEQHILLGDKQVESRYVDERHAWFSQLKEALSSIGLPMRQISAGRPIEQQLATSKSGLILGEAI